MPSIYKQTISYSFCLKPIPSFYLKFLATNLELKVCIDPSVWYFLLNTHLYPISLESRGKVVRTHALLYNHESISLSIASRASN